MLLPRLTLLHIVYLHKKEINFWNMKTHIIFFHNTFKSSKYVSTKKHLISEEIVSAYLK